MLGATVLIGSVYLLVLPLFSEALLEFVLAAIDDVRSRQPRGGVRDPVLPGDVPRHVFAVRHPAAAALGAELRPVSGTVYGVSTAGTIVGTLGTTFFLIPPIGTRAITLTLGAGRGHLPAHRCWRSAHADAARVRHRWLPCCRCWR